MMVRVARRGATIEAARGAGIVLAQNREGQTEYYGEQDQGTSSDAQADSQDQQMAREAALPADSQVPVDLAGALPQPAQSTGGEGIVDALPSAAEMAAGAVGGRAGQIDGSAASTSIFGAEGTGNKFVYLFDRSASMEGYQGRPLAAAKSQLISSLDDLQSTHQFQIVFYNERPTVFNPTAPRPPRMLFGDSATKRLAQNFVRGIVAAGGTRHMEALKLAIGMSPDVIFFLTDAAEPQLSLSQLDEIRRRNARVGAAIHTIEFGVGSARGNLNFLMRLAQQNGGHYVYVDVTGLPLE